MHGGLLRYSLDTGIHGIFGSAFLPFIQPAEHAYQGLIARVHGYGSLITTSKPTTAHSSPSILAEEYYRSRPVRCG